jgi:hypothetical protein
MRLDTPVRILPVTVAQRNSVGPRMSFVPPRPFRLLVALFHWGSVLPKTVTTGLRTGSKDYRYGAVLALTASFAIW